MQFNFEEQAERGPVGKVWKVTRFHDRLPMGRVSWSPVSRHYTFDPVTNCDPLSGVQLAELGERLNKLTEERLASEEQSRIIESMQLHEMSFMPDGRVEIGFTDTSHT